MTSTPRTRTPKKSKSAKAADIQTNRWESELPILDRVLPLDLPSKREPSVEERSGETTGTDVANRDAGNAVTVNEQQLIYDTPTVPRRWRRKLLTVLLPVVAASVAAGSVLIPAAAGAQTGAEVDVKSVRFDLDTDGPGAKYRSVIVVNDGGEQRLTPMAGSVRVTIEEDDAKAMSAVVDGDVSGVATEGFADSVAAAATSRDVNGFVRLGRDSSGKPASFTLFFERPLGSGDHILIQEGNGDGIVEIAAVDAAGAQTGSAVVISSPYELNTGHGLNGNTAWASVVAVDRFGLGGATIAGIRVGAADSDVKAVALVAASENGSGVLRPGGSAVAQEVGGQASVGLAAKVQPAIALDGTGCVTSGPAAFSAGQAVTFCFVVTNLGSTNLSQFRFTDPQLGLEDAVLPLAAGAEALAPGQEAIFYHHAVAGSQADQVSAMVSAQPVDDAGAPLAESASSSSPSITGTVAAETVTQAEDQGTADAQPAEIVEAPLALAADVTATGVPAGDVPAVDVPAVDVPAVDVPAIDVDAVDVPAVDVPSAQTATAAQTESVATAPTQLAMTGMPTEPWILVILAMGLIFIGYTAVAAFGRAPSRDGSSGHDQLDALGFD